MSDDTFDPPFSDEQPCFDGEQDDVLAARMAEIETSSQTVAPAAGEVSPRAAEAVPAVESASEAPSAAQESKQNDLNITQTTPFVVPEFKSRSLVDYLSASGASDFDAQPARALVISHRMHVHTTEQLQAIAPFFANTAHRIELVSSQIKTRIDESIDGPGGAAERLKAIHDGGIALYRKVVASELVDAAEKVQAMVTDFEAKSRAAFDEHAARVKAEAERDFIQKGVGLFAQVNDAIAQNQAKLLADQKVLAEERAQLAHELKSAKLKYAIFGLIASILSCGFVFAIAR